MELSVLAKEVATIIDSTDLVYRQGGRWRWYHGTIEWHCVRAVTVQCGLGAVTVECVGANHQR